MMDTRPDETVLLVDDSRAIRRILASTLVQAGYRVVEASNGEEGLTLAGEEAPDLILLDVDMPVLDGLSTMRLLQADPELSAIPVLFLTARTSSSDAAAGLTLGARDYLRKPCAPEELLARVAGALQVSRAQRALQSRTAFLDDLSTTDPLTGLGNRRRYELWAAELQNSAGDAAPVAIALADLDRFKAVNDTLGHLVGDTVLSITARRIRSAAGDGDTVVRWGGEEFLLLRSGTACDDIAQTGERMRQAVAETPMAVGVDQTIPITISVGCAVGVVADLVTTIEAADRALYAAKRHGRNKVIVDGSGELVDDAH